MRINKRHLRSRVRMVERNCNMLSLAEAVRREERDGFFPMVERSEEGGFEASSNDFDTSGSITHLSKVETALRGIDAANKMMLAPEGKKPIEEPAPAPVPDPKSE